MNEVSPATVEEVSNTVITESGAIAPTTSIAPSLNGDIVGSTDGADIFNTPTFLETFGLNWDVAVLPNFVQIPDKNKNLEYIPTGFKTVVRMDNNSVLGQVGKIYQPIQNAQIVDVISQVFATNNLIPDNARCVNGGSRFFVSAQLPESAIIGGKETMDYSIYALSSHEGSFALRFGIITKVISCQNQFSRLLANKGSVKIRHTQSGAMFNLKEASQMFSSFIAEKQSMESLFERLAGFKFKNQKQEVQLRDSIVQILMDTPAKASVATELAELSSRKQNLIAQIQKSLNMEIANKGASAWGLFNGVTWYFNHERFQKETSKDSQVSSLMMGQGYSKMNKVLDFLREVAA